MAWYQLASQLKNYLQLRLKRKHFLPFSGRHSVCDPNNLNMRILLFVWKIAASHYFHQSVMLYSLFVAATVL